MSAAAPIPNIDLANAAQLLSRKLDMDCQSAEQLIRLARLVQLPRGETLFSQGEPSFHFYLLLQGQLRGQRCRLDGQVDLVLPFFPGEMIGELGFFDHTARTLSIAARRDSILLEINQDALEKFGEYSRAVYSHLIRVLISRFKREVGYSSNTAQQQFILMQSFLGPGEQGGNVLDSLLAEMSCHGSLRRWKRLGDIPEGSLPSETARTIELIEAEPQALVDDRLLDELDTMVLVLDSSIFQNPQSCHRLKAQLGAADNELPVWVVLVHEARQVEPQLGTRVIELLGGGFKLLHLRSSNHADLARVVRHVLGLTVGLVLGGGGARGFAHAGFYRALEEAGIVVDSVGGTSMGALVGALVSTGRNAAEVNKTLADNFPKGLPFRLSDYRLPRHGLVKSQAADRVYRHAFGELRIEDQPIPFFAVSCNLTTGNQYLFEKGPLWEAVRATTSIPVFFEPHVHGQQVMVDGALVNNVPVDCMRARGARKILTVDVGLEADITMGAAANGDVRLPGVMKALMRVIELGGIEKSRQARLIGDYYVQPPIENIGLMDFERRDEIVSIGYEAGRRAIPDILALINKNNSTPG